MLTHAVLSLPPAEVAALCGVLALGGVVKGVLGIGLPLVLVPAATRFLALPAAVALLSVPIVSANLRQALEGGGMLPALRRLSPIAAALVAGTLFGVHLLIHSNQETLDVVVGASFVLLAALLLCRPRIRLDPGAERWASPFVGLLAGLIGGMSAMFGPPLVFYQISLGVDPHTFVKHMAILALAGGTTLLLALGSLGSMSPADLLVSVIAVLPIQLGMPLGRRLRRRVPPILFRAAVLSVLAWAGLDMLRRAFT